MTGTTSASATGRRKIEWLLFATAFIAFGYFHQGGGWNQNGRFAMVRAMVEEGRFSVDSYLIYSARMTEQKTVELTRVPVRNAEFTLQGKSYALVWTDSLGRPVPISKRLEGIVASVDAQTGTVEMHIGKDGRMWFTPTQQTRVTRNGKNAAAGDIAAGSVLDVTFAITDEGKVIAQEIEITDKTVSRDIVFLNLEQTGATGDLAFDRGHFHPNKAPGTSFIAAPAYFVIYWLERLFGVNPDSWWTLTCNAWLVSVFSVGLLSAIGCVLFFRLATDFSNGSTVPSLLATLAFAFGTMFFPYATMLFEHNIIAVALLASFYLLYKVKTKPTENAALDGQSPRDKMLLYLFLSGVCAGYAAITNYIIVVVVVLLGTYLILGVRKKMGWLWFGLGLLGPFLLICAYNVACFGTPFTTNYRHQNPLFQSGSKAFLGVFIGPQVYDGSVVRYIQQAVSVLVAVLISPFRGLFFSSPVLLLGVAGIVWLFKQKQFRAEAWLMSAVLLFFLLFISHYNGWHGGWATMPRYLLPALPFLALPMVLGFTHFFKTSIALAAVSAAITLVSVAVDPQSPLGTGTPAVVAGRPNVHDKPLASSFAYNPLTEYELPFFLTGNADWIVRANLEGLLEQQNRKWAAEGHPAAVRERQLASLRQQLESDVARGESKNLPLEMTPLALSTVKGHVSVNPMGIYEGWFYRVFPARSVQAVWNSFNVGEFLFPESRLSLLPLLGIVGSLGFAALQTARNLPSETSKPKKKRDA